MAAIVDIPPGSFHSEPVRPKLDHMQRPLHEYPMRSLNRPAPSVEVRRADKGVVYLSCAVPYEPGLPSLIDYLARAAELRPNTTFLAERDGAKQWRRLTYAAAARDTAAVATWLIAKGFFVTAGAGYYLFTGTGATPIAHPTMGYGYGNVGLAYEWHSWRVDVGYFLTEERAQRLFPYPYANDRFAGTLSWRF